MFARRSWFVHWTHNVYLVVFPRMVAAIDVENVVRSVDSKYGIRRVPMDVVHPRRVRRCRQMKQREDNCTQETGGILIKLQTQGVAAEIALLQHGAAR